MKSTTLTVILLCCVFTALIDGCHLPMDHGTRCDEPEETRWYFNAKKFRCLAFRYLGCDGNDENNFPSKSACEKKCIPANAPTCVSSLFTPPAHTDCSGESGEECPDGFVCKNGALFSQCCNITGEGWFDQASSLKCNNGKRVHLIDGRDIHVGDSCHDIACPHRYKCERTNPLFAKCCSRYGH